MLGSLLVKIAAAVFKKALILGGLKTIATAYQIYSIFGAISDLAECVSTANDCDVLGICGLELISDPLSEAVVERLIGVGSERFVVEKTASGIYVASSLLPAFRTSAIDFPSIAIAASPRIAIAPSPHVRIK